MHIYIPKPTPKYLRTVAIVLYVQAPYGLSYTPTTFIPQASSVAAETGAPPASTNDLTEDSQWNSKGSLDHEPSKFPTPGGSNYLCAKRFAVINRIPEHADAGGRSLWGPEVHPSVPAERTAAGIDSGEQAAEANAENAEKAPLEFEFNQTPK